MERYWNRRARQDPFHFVDNRQIRGRPDLASFWQAGEQALDRLLGDLGIELTGEENVVEIGCGVGRLTRALARRVRSVDALDISDTMLAHARQYNAELHNVEWLHGDGRTLAPLPDGAYDACISFVVFQHLPNPELTYGYVREIGRVLAPGGWAAFQVSTDLRLHQRPQGLGRVRHALTRRIYHHPAWWGSAVELPALREVAARAGLEIDEVRYEGSWFCLIRAQRHG